jgi:hypothetical protein
MARDRQAQVVAEPQAHQTENPEPYSARGVNLSSYTIIIGNCNTQVKIT